MGCDKGRVVTTLAKTPRYVDLAIRLRQAIASGRFDVGSQLPTEHELCERHRVSRHTARAALKMLEDEGLIDRRPGLGTRIISTETKRGFSQPLGGLDDLLQYAHEARLAVHAVSPATLTASQARLYGAARGSPWLRIEGVRRVRGAAIAATTILVAAAVGARAADFRKSSRAVVEMIEEKYSISVGQITQRITAERIEEADAATLGRAIGEPILRTIRRYLDASERLYVISDSRHPGNGFAYEMTYRRVK